jgi:nucleoid-associated protein YgaU
MSKEVLFAGILAVVCLILVSVAFLAPKHLHPTPPKDDAQVSADNLTPENDTATAGTAGTAGTTAPPTAFTGQTAGTSTGGFSNPSTSSSLAQNGSTGGFTAESTFTTGGTSTGFSTTGGSSSSFGTTASHGTTGMGTSAGYGTTSSQPIPQVQPAGDEGDSDTTAKTHIVAASETLGEISQQYYNTHRYWKKILEANPGLDPNALKVGQKIIIPVVNKKTTPLSSSGAGDVSGGEGTYTVAKDDSYYKIAEKQLGNASRWKEIEKLNDIEPEDLHVGQVIKLPPKTSAVAPAKDETSPDAQDSDGKTHIVAAGETLSDISKQYYGTTKHWRAIVKANPTVDADALKVGQKLIIPDIAGSPKHDASPVSELSAPSEGGTHIYIVQKNDSLKSIAAKELGSAKAFTRIQEANPGVDPHKLRIGQKLKIPGKDSGTDGADATPEAHGGFNSPPPAAPSHGGTGGGANPFSAPAPMSPAPAPFSPAPAPAPAPLGPSTAPAPLSNTQPPTAAGVSP